MAQKQVWENEYRQPRLVTKGEAPQQDVLRLLKFLKRKQGLDLSGLAVLDLGAGTGRNANYLAGLGNEVIGVEIAPTAVKLARERAAAAGLAVRYAEQSMAEALPAADQSIDLVLDITSSNSLSQVERAAYLSELGRVMKPGSYLVLKTLCLEGDKNARELMKRSPGTELGTYLMPELGLVERAFTREDLLSLYGQAFEPVLIERKTSYTRMNGRSYKRNFWLAVWRKR